MRGSAGAHLRFHAMLKQTLARIAVFHRLLVVFDRLFPQRNRGDLTLLEQLSTAFCDVFISIIPAPQ